MTDSDTTDDTTRVPENSDTTNPPHQLGDDTDWHCAMCGDPVADAEALAFHDCPAEAPPTED